MWHTIKKIPGKNKNVPDISIRLDGVKINNEEVANGFNLHFTTSPSNSNSPNDYNFLMSNVPFSVNTCFVPSVSELDVILLINKLKSSNPSGFDNILNNLLKKCKYLLCNTLAHFINLCLGEGIFPTMLKLAIVQPLFKKGGSNVYKNYRAISILSSESKLFELAIKEPLESF